MIGRGVRNWIGLGIGKCFWNKVLETTSWELGIGNWYSLFCVDYSMLGLIHQCYHNHTHCLLAPVSVDFIFSDE